MKLSQLRARMKRVPLRAAVVLQQYRKCSGSKRAVTADNVHGQLARRMEIGKNYGPCAALLAVSGLT